MARAPHSARPGPAFRGVQSLGQSEEKEVAQKSEQKSWARSKRAMTGVCPSKNGITEAMLRFNQMNLQSLLKKY